MAEGIEQKPVALGEGRWAQLGKISGHPLEQNRITRQKGIAVNALIAQELLKGIGIGNHSGQTRKPLATLPSAKLAFTPCNTSNNWLGL